MATEGLETQISRVVLNAERKAENLYTAGDSTDDCEEGPKACPITLSQVRRVRFKDDESKETNKPLPANEEDSTQLEATEPDLNSKLEIQRRQPTRRVETSVEAGFGDTQPSSQGDEVELNASRAPSTDDIDPVVVQAERRRRIDRAQDEELRGELSQLPFRRVRSAGKVADDFVLSEEDGLLYRHNRNRRRGGDDEPSLDLRLVIPTTMVDEVLQNCHNAVEGGHQGIVRTYHRVKSDYYWIGCGAARSIMRRLLYQQEQASSQRTYPGNIVSDRPFHILSMDFVIPLPRTQRGNTALLLFQDHFTGFVIAKAMAETGALEAAKVFEESVFRRFGDPSLVRHDRDPRFMSEVLQKFSEMMQSKSRATLSYRPQANGQQ
ncbi:Reverse transcriptase [Phytophthora palmivora]|uniref:Reverse transcriptase n=1 Tax=Phytophthora palmivora TaxID=4796 RepID=A0A2P4X034_9STRA|nr:Reverse transcriptase [Phytophthora palmivora]